MSIKGMKVRNESHCEWKQNEGACLEEEKTKGALHYWRISHRYWRIRISSTQ